MSTKLELRFKTGEGKSKTIGINQPVLDIDQETVEAAMQKIIDQNLFEKEGVNLFASVRGARYVTRTVADVFETE
ncbi:DUF2922 domain-containing protein [Marinilactibacillus piezotolerans]|uniref:DUF2922 domain-containing protein n=1 Tax=Marinilactibacillus piezotolerans TaxID=258723 RepID=UPI0021179C81|nr:DUF2922 domain-containing protein [Marinilactibacillus piezotolerans]